MRNLIGIVALSLLAAVAGCASDDTSTKQTTLGTSYDPENPFAEVEQSLNRFAVADCGNLASTTAMTITLANTPQIVIAKRVVDGAITVNGTNCGPSATVKTITVTGTAADEMVIVDYTNGAFATGTSTAGTGINIDLKGATGTNKVGIKGTAQPDTVTMGKDSTSKYWAKMNTDAYLDVILNVTTGALPDTIVYLGAGADVFAAGPAGAANANNYFTEALTVYGGAGNDTFNQVEWATPEETIDGGADTDTVSYALRASKVTVTVGTGADDGLLASTENDNITDTVEIVTGGTIADDLTADDGGSILNGGPGNDTLQGGAGDDSLSGGTGNDTIIGDAGNDTLNGNENDDYFDEEDASNGGDVINGSTGTDTVDYSGRSNGIVVTMDGADADDGEDSETDNIKADVEEIIGTDQDDDITGNVTNNIIIGGLGNDTLSGGAGDDYFDESNNCTTSTDGLGNLYCSAAGTEDATNGNGNDVITGGAGVDTVDYMRNDAVTVVMDGETSSGYPSEADVIATDVEACYGGVGDDDITGNDGANLLVGGDGDDTLSGGLGDDELVGGGDTSDEVDGGEGDGDICYGATTATTCEF